MTAQISDTVRYDSEVYCLAGVDGSGLFDPADHGLRPTSWCTACWRGYALEYAVAEGHLVLSRLDVSLTNPASARSDKFDCVPAPVVKGCEATKAAAKGLGFFEYSYRDMGLRVSFTGGLLVARGFIKDLYVHMGFHPAWKYETVHELIFERGQLASASDMSKKMAEFRAEMSAAALQPGFEQGPEKVKKWIEACFSRDYRL